MRAAAVCVCCKCTYVDVDALPGDVGKGGGDDRIRAPAELASTPAITNRLREIAVGAIATHHEVAPSVLDNEHGAQWVRALAAAQLLGHLGQPRGVFHCLGLRRCLGAFVFVHLVERDRETERQRDRETERNTS
jgi:hypothetical protein